MLKIKYIVNRINEYAIRAEQKSGINKKILFLDCLWNCVLQRCTIRDYFIYEFYWLNRKGKRRYISGIEQNNWQEKHNNKEVQNILKNKEESLKYFSAYIQRDWCGRKYRNSREEYKRFEKKHCYGIAKPLDGCGGEGIKRLDFTQLGLSLYEYCKENNLLIEEEISQHESLKKLYPYSVNTIRMVTHNGKLVAAVLRIGRSGKQVDNLSAGGIAAAVELNKGVVYTLGRTFMDEKFIFHPDTDVLIPGFSIPMWQECKILVEKAVLLCEGIPTVGFDIAVTETGPTIVEVNEGTEIEAVQLPYNMGFRNILRC